MLTFNLKFFIFALVLFVVEVLIALFVTDSIIRPYGGDYLVVIWLYCVIRTFLKAPPVAIAIGILVFSFCLEVLQYHNLVDRLGLSNSKIAKTVIGYGFDWWDLVAYTLGIATVLLVEKFYSESGESASSV